MSKTFISMLAALLLFSSLATAVERPGVEFKVFQFPRNMIPRIDGKTDDWDIVPDDYIIGTEELTDEKTPGRPMNKKSLDVKVRVGWVNGLNRLYFCYEAFDDYWNMFYRRGDIFELLVDGDLSGGDAIYNPTFKGRDNYFKYQGILSQNYHIYTPPGEGRDWAMIWGCQPWIRELPWANYAYDYSFKDKGDKSKKGR